MNIDESIQLLDGNREGHKVIFAMGEFESGNVNASGEDVYRGEDFTPDAPVRLPTPATAGEQMTVVSESQADNGTSTTGVLTIRIEYLDACGKEQTEDIILNGTSGVDTKATDIRFVNDMYALTVGTSGVSAGNIGIYKKGGDVANNLYNMIATGGNKSLVPNRMVPVDKDLYLTGWHCEEAQSKRAVFRIRSTDMHGVLIPGVFCFKDTAYLKGTASGFRPLNVKVPALSQVKVSYWAIATGAEGSCAWTGILVDKRI